MSNASTEIVLENPDLVRENKLWLHPEALPMEQKAFDPDQPRDGHAKRPAPKPTDQATSS